jgi:hypothetical protein
MLAIPRWNPACGLPWWARWNGFGGGKAVWRFLTR